MSATTDTTPKTKGGWWALSPLAVFLCLYLVTSLLVNDFYKVPITVAFLASSCYAIAITRGLNLEQRIYQFSVGASNKNIMLMVWIFILAGAFAQSAKQMGAIDATVNLTLHILPDNLLLAGIFIAACFISLSIGTSVGTIVALTPVAVGLAEKTGIDLPYMVAIVVERLVLRRQSFLHIRHHHCIDQDAGLRDEGQVPRQLHDCSPAALVVLGLYIFQGLSVSAPPQVQTIEWIKVIPYLIVLGTAVAGVNVMLVLLLGILSTGIIGIYTGTAFFDWFGAMGTGITGMGELIIITLLAGGMLETIRYNGGIDFIISPADPPRQRQAGSRIQHRRPGRHRQSLHRQQHHCHHHHRPHSQGHRPPLPPGPPENSQHTGHLLMPRARNHPLRSANADSLRTCRHFTHQHHRKPVLPLLHGNMRHTRHSAEIPQEILGRRMSDK